LIGEDAVSRRKIHDLTIAATMIDHEISQLLAYNNRDFNKIDEISRKDML